MLTEIKKQQKMRVGLIRMSRSKKRFHRARSLIKRRRNSQLNKRNLQRNKQPKFNCKKNKNLSNLLQCLLNKNRKLKSKIPQLKLKKRKK
jgi:hypothetical protein